MNSRQNPRYNAEGYHDPTPYEAIKNVSSREYLAKKVVKTIQNVAHLAGFDIVGKIILKDHKSGKFWR